MQAQELALPVDLAQFAPSMSETGESGENKQSSQLPTQKALDSMETDSCDSFLQADILNKVQKNKLQKASSLQKPSLEVSEASSANGEIEIDLD